MCGVTGILLAAGSSRRFGADKQATLIDGVPMLERAARTLLDAGFVAPIVVLGPRAAEHRRLLHGLPLRLVENSAAATGMASSLVTALEAAQDSEAVVVTLCDQPAVTPAHLQALVQRWRQGNVTIVASAYGEARGVPALFAATHFPELRQLSGDRGAAPLLHTADLIPLPGGNHDIDTTADLARYANRNAARPGSNS